MTTLVGLGVAVVVALVAYTIGWKHAVIRLRPEIDRMFERNDP